MDNHYHVLIETNSPTLSKGMKFLNGTYTQYFNRRHQRVGHVFQGRYKAILVQKHVHLLELARYLRDFVQQGKGQPSPWKQLNNPISLG